MPVVANRQKLTKHAVESAPAKDVRYTVWDTALPGFGVRIAPTGVRTFIVRYRPLGNSSLKRFMTIGRFGPITVDQARKRAQKILGDVADGQDPAARSNARHSAPTLAEVAAEFQKSHISLKLKPTTAASYTLVLNRYIVPKFGNHKLSSVSRAEVAKLHESMSATPYMANSTVALLGSLYSWAARRGLAPDGLNPARRIDRFEESARERFLTMEEFARLGAALREAETVGIPYDVDEARPTAKHAAKPENRLVIIAPDALAAIELLVLTGCRLREILNLRWQEIDFERGLLFLQDSKTGRKTVVLGAPAITVLKSLPHVGDCVFPGSDGTKPRSDLKRPWAAIKRHAGLTGLRIHDLRHSFASVGAGAGLGLPVIGRLLGHSQPGSTAQYAHLADEATRRASETIAGQIAAAMGGKSAGADTSRD